MTPSSTWGSNMGIQATSACILFAMVALVATTEGNSDSMRVCYRVNGQPMTCAANTMCFTAYEDFRRNSNVIAKGCMTTLNPGCVNCPSSLMKHFPKPRNGGPERLPKLCCFCDYDGCNAEGVKLSSGAAGFLVFAVNAYSLATTLLMAASVLFSFSGVVNF